MIVDRICTTNVYSRTNKYKLHLDLLNREIKIDSILLRRRHRPAELRCTPWIPLPRYSPCSDYYRDKLYTNVIYIYIENNKIYAIIQPNADEEVDEDIPAERSRWNNIWRGIGIRRRTYDGIILNITSYVTDFNHITYLNRTPSQFISNIRKPDIKNHIIDIIEQINREDQE